MGNNMFIEKPASRASLVKRKPVYGVGINDADYITSKQLNGKFTRCPYYLAWKSMLSRCYSKSVNSYDDCFVCDEWLLFSVFRAWMDSQPWEGGDLDKDLLLQGNKKYSPSTCLFVPHAINQLLTNRAKARGNYKQGVIFRKQKGVFISQISIYGKCHHIGSFHTEEEAHSAYLIKKYEHIKEIALNQVEPLRSALLNYKIKG